MDLIGSGNQSGSDKWYRKPLVLFAIRIATMVLIVFLWQILINWPLANLSLPRGLVNIVMNSFLVIIFGALYLISPRFWFFPYFTAALAVVTTYDFLFKASLTGFIDLGALLLAVVWIIYCVQRRKKKLINVRR